MKILTNLDLVKNQLLNCVIQKVAVDPATKLAEGWIIFNTNEAVMKYYNGEEWVTIGSGGGGSVDIDTTITSSSTNTKAAGAKAVYDFVTENLADIRAVANGDVLIVDSTTGNVVGIGIDTAVTEDSVNLVTSGAVSDALQEVVSAVEEFITLNLTSKANIYRKFNPALTADANNNCSWVIDDIALEEKANQYPSVNIYEVNTGEIVLTDVSVNFTDEEITISFKQSGDISSDKYVAVIVV